MATRTISNAGGNWSDAAAWVEGSVPTVSDDVVATATSGNLVLDTGTPICKSFDMTGYVGALTHTGAVGLKLGDTTHAAGNFKLVPGMTYAPGSATTITLSGSDSATHQFTSAGKNLGNVTINAVGSAVNWQLQDTLTMQSTLNVVRGGFDSNNRTINANAFFCNNSLAAIITLGTSVITLTGGSAWTFIATNLTLSAASSTIIMSGATAVFAGAAQAYGLLRLTGTGVATISGSNSFADTFERSNAAAVTLTLTAGTTQTVTNPPILAGKPGKLLTLQSSSAGSAATISEAAGTVRANHASIKDSTVSGGATFLAYDAINVSGNTGWSFQRAKQLAMAGVG